jgi:hypothetical protein
VTAERVRGVAAMDPAQHRASARLGGQAAHASGPAHEFTRDEARHAGKKGDSIVSKARARMTRIARRGGKASGRKKQREKDQPEKDMR